MNYLTLFTLIFYGVIVVGISISTFILLRYGPLLPISAGDKKENSAPAMKKYALFVCHLYKTNGGWMDFAGSFNSVEEAFESRVITEDEAAHVVDLHTGEFIRLQEKE